MAAAGGESGNLAAAMPPTNDPYAPTIEERDLPPQLRNLVLTPLKLRLEARHHTIYAAAYYWSYVVFFLLLLLQLEEYINASWYVVFSPLWAGHAICLINQISFWGRGNVFVRAQLGPPPPSNASTGIMILYRTMSKYRFRNHMVDCVGAILDHCALGIVEGIICWLLATGRLSDPTVCWRLVFLPFWIVWPWCLADYGLNYPSERHPGALRMLFTTQALLVALKLDGIGAYSWNVTFVITWLWLGSLFLTGSVLMIMVLFNGTCLKIKDIPTVVGYGFTMVSCSSMLPSFVYLARVLEGYPDVRNMQILLPQITGWLGLWVASLAITYAIIYKTNLRRQLAAAGRVWTRQEDAARILLSTELENTQVQVSQMSDDALADLALKLMMGKGRPTELMKVGSTLYRRMAQLTLQQTTTALLVNNAKAAAAATVTTSDTDGPQGDETGPQLALKGRMSSNQEEALVSSGELEMGMVTVQINLLPGSSPRPDQGPHAADQAPDSDTGVAPAPSAAPAELPEGTGQEEEEEEELCTICYDGAPTCVLLECGHGGYCWRCAHILYMKPPNECPVCRRRIELVVEVSDPRSQVGQPASVRLREPQRRRRIMRAPSCLRPISPGV